MLTEAIIRRFESHNSPLQADELFLFGGRNDDASRERIAAFHATESALLGGDTVDSVQSTGYSPEITRQAFEAFYARRGCMPRAIFINSSTNLEGLLRFMVGRPPEMFSELVVGCYDYDPFGSFLPFPMIMIPAERRGDRRQGARTDRRAKRASTDCPDHAGIDRPGHGIEGAAGHAEGLRMR